MIQWKIKRFEALSLQELYSALELRSEVFVVEQNCVYQDIDNKDQKAFHVLGYLHNELVAYARLFRAGDYFEQASIGRVVVSPKHRNKAFGHDLMKISKNRMTFKGYGNTVPLKKGAEYDRRVELVITKI